MEQKQQITYNGSIDILIVTKEESLLPRRWSQSAMCIDLCASEDIKFFPGQTKVPTWVKLAMPSHVWAKIYARSSTYEKAWVTLANWVWIIDSDYRGELFVSILATAEWEIKKWEKIAQLSFEPNYITLIENKIINRQACQFKVVVDEKLFNELDTQLKTERGDWSFWSTDKTE